MNGGIRVINVESVLMLKVEEYSMNMSETVLNTINQDLQEKEQELEQCGLFDVIDKYFLKQEIRDLEAHKRALIRSGLSEKAGVKA